MFGKAIIALTLAAAVIAQELTVNSIAALIQCQPALVSWSGGTAPYYVAAIPGGQPSAAAIKDFGEQNGKSLTWTVDLAVGTSVTIKITDSTGAVNYNQAVDIQAGSSNSCLTASSSGANVAAGSATSGAASASSAAGSMMSSMTSMGAVSSASAAVASKASSAAGVASSARSGAASAASGASSGAAASAASASPSGAANHFAVAPVAGVFAVVLGAAGLAWV